MIHYMMISEVSIQEHETPESEVETVHATETKRRPGARYQNGLSMTNGPMLRVERAMRLCLIWGAESWRRY